MLPFTPELQRMAADAFAHEVLVDRLHAAEVVVGRNFTFGHKAAGDVAAARPSWAAASGSASRAST